jgi:hypothetical protein
MARQADSCWHCGAQWASEDVPRTTLRAITGGRLVRPAAEAARADADRWMNEGGSVESRAVAVALPAVSARS